MTQLHHHDTKHFVLTHQFHYLLGIALFVIGLGLPVPHIASQMIDVIALLLSGYHVMIEGIVDTIQTSKTKRKLMTNTHLLMTLAALGAVMQGETKEAALLIFIFSGAHFLEGYVEGKSNREITNLLKMNPTQARRITADGKVDIVAVERLEVNDLVQVKNGDQVPADGVITDGLASINEATINGESIPQEKSVGDRVFAATINGNSTFTMSVTKRSDESVFAKILKMVANAQENLSPAAAGIKKYEPIYVNIVLAIFLLLLVGSPIIFGWTWSETLSRSLVFLVSASPCAIAVSAIPATLASMSHLARQGVLFKGGAFLSNFANLKAVAFDKTGTLTKGQPEVVAYSIDPQYDDVLPIIVAMEKQSNHPLANAIITKFAQEDTGIAVSVTQLIGQGLQTVYDDKLIQIAKPSVFERVSSNWLIAQESYEKQGKTVMFIAVDKMVIGLIAVQDVPQEESVLVMDYLRKENIHSIMLTGDAKLTGDTVGQMIGIDTVVADVLPDQKAAIVMENKAKYGMVGMVGDGVNDAPGLAKADIGIAMGDGTDVAIETADVVVMKNNLTNIVKAHQASKRLKWVVVQNVGFSLLIVLLLIALSLSGRLSVVAGVMAHEGSTVIVLLNSLRLLMASPNSI